MNGDSKLELNDTSARIINEQVIKLKEIQSNLLHCRIIKAMNGLMNEIRIL